MYLRMYITHRYILGQYESRLHTLRRRALFSILLTLGKLDVMLISSPRCED
jgi:hypothetical protein